MPHTAPRSGYQLPPMAALSSLHCVYSRVALHAQQTGLHPIPSFALQCYCLVCGSTAAEGSPGAAALRAVGSLLGVLMPAVSSSPGKAKGNEAMSEQSCQVSPCHSVCGSGALVRYSLPAVPSSLV